MVCQGLETLGGNSTIVDLMSYPTICDPYFFVKILSAFWVILVSVLFYYDQERTGKGDMLSSMAIASFAIIFLASIGTLVGFFSNTVFIQFLVVNMIIIVFWFFRN